MRNFIFKGKNCKGQGLVEYALLIVLIAGIIFTAARPLKNAVNGAFVRASTSINTAS